jgi:DNA polymerase-3 subunit epsilon
MNHREAARAWAQEMLNQPLGHVLILDTETCDLNGEVIELAIVDTAGNELYNRRFCPRTEIAPGAQAVHGISAEMLRGEPCFATEYLAIHEILAPAARVLIYNAPFDLRCLAVTCSLHKAAPLPLTINNTACLMRMYAQWYGERGRSGYKWQRLMGGSSQSGPSGHHSALGDARAALDVLRKMAGEDGAG